MALCLMYHNFVEREEERASFPSEHRRYVLTRRQLRAHLDAARALGWRFAAPCRFADGWSGRNALLLTFDDSWDENLSTAEALAAQGIAGIFFLNSANLGFPQMLSESAVRRIASLGHEIGSHGVEHEFFAILDDGALKRTLEQSKYALETLCGHRVRFVSLPGGRLDARTARAAAAAGYEAVFTSLPGFLEARHGRILLNRMAITADITPRRFEAMLQAPLLRIAKGRLRYGLASLSRMMGR